MGGVLMRKGVIKNLYLYLQEMKSIIIVYFT